MSETPLWRLVAGQKKGPYEPALLRPLVKDGRISPLDRFSYDGVTWQAPTEFPELFREPPPPQQPPAPAAADVGGGTPDEMGEAAVVGFDPSADDQAWPPLLAETARADSDKIPKPVLWAIGIGGTTVALMVMLMIVTAILSDGKRSRATARNPEKPKASPKEAKPKADKANMNESEPDKADAATEPEPEEPKPEEPEPDPAAVAQQAADPAKAEADRERAAAKQAFDEDIAKAIRERDHMPLLSPEDAHGLNGGHSDARTITLCSLGQNRCPIVLKVPETFGSFRMSCRPQGDDPLKATHWAFESTPETGGDPLPCGSAEIKSDGDNHTLIVTLDKEVDRKDSRHKENRLARFALATGAIAICHAEYADDRDLQAFVQTAMPAREPFVVEEFFFADGLRANSRKPDPKEAGWTFPISPHRLLLADYQGNTSAGDRVRTTIGEAPDAVVEFQAAGRQMGTDGTLPYIDSLRPVRFFLAADSQTAFPSKDDPSKFMQTNVVLEWTPPRNGLAGEQGRITFLRLTDCIVPVHSAGNPFKDVALMTLPRNRDLGGLAWPRLMPDDWCRLAAASILRDLKAPYTAAALRKTALMLKKADWADVVGSGKDIAWSDLKPLVGKYLDRGYDIHRNRLIAKHNGNQVEAAKDPTYPRAWFDSQIMQVTSVEVPADILLPRALVALLKVGDEVFEDYDRAYELMSSLGDGDFWITGKLVAQVGGPGLPPGMRAVLVEFVPPVAADVSDPDVSVSTDSPRGIEGAATR